MADGTGSELHVRIGQLGKKPIAGGHTSPFHLTVGDNHWDEAYASGRITSLVLSLASISCAKARSRLVKASSLWVLRRKVTLL